MVMNPLSNVKSNLENMLGKTISRVKMPLFLAMAAATINSCSKDGGVEPPKPEPPGTTTDKFSYSVFDDRGNSTGYLILNGKDFPVKDTSVGDNTVTIQFTQEQYDNFATSATGKGSQSLTAKTVAFDAFELRVGNTVVYTDNSPTISKNTVNTNDVSNNKDLYSHDFFWIGNASVATFYFLNQDRSDTLKIASPQAFPPPKGTALETQFFDENKETTIHIIGKKDGYNDVIANNVNINDYLEYKGGEGLQGGYLFTPVNQTSADVAVTPISGQSAFSNTNITLTNQDFPSYTYQQSAPGDQAVFEGIFIEGDSDNYIITVEDNLPDGRFFTTIDTVSIAVGSQTNQTIELDVVQDKQKMNWVLRDFDNLNSFVADHTGTLINANTQEVIGSATSDGNGMMTFEDVPGGIDYQLITEGPGYYKKTSDIMHLNHVTNISQTEATHGTVPVRIQYDSNGVEMDLNLLNSSRPQKDNVEAALAYTGYGEDDKIMNFHAPEHPSKDVVVGYMNDVLSNAKVHANIAGDFVGYPTGDIISQYYPYEGPNRQIFDGQVYFNIQGYLGNDVDVSGKTIQFQSQNSTYQRDIVFWASVIQMGGDDESANDHEVWNIFARPNQDGNRTLDNGQYYQTATDIDAADNVPSTSFDYDYNEYWTRTQNLHYDNAFTITNPIGEVEYPPFESTITLKLEK